MPNFTWRSGNNERKLHQLHHQVVQTLEEERRRISWELHDELGQALTAIKIKLELVADTICQNCMCKPELTKIIDLTDDAVEMTRHIAYNLRPAALEAVGLIPALRNYCRTFTQRVGDPGYFYLRQNRTAHDLRSGQYHALSSITRGVNKRREAFSSLTDRGPFTNRCRVYHLNRAR